MRVLRASSRRTHQNANGRGGNFQLKARCSRCILTICGGARASVLCVPAEPAAVKSKHAGFGHLSILLDGFLLFPGLAIEASAMVTVSLVSVANHPTSCSGPLWLWFANRTPTGNSSPGSNKIVETQSMTVTSAQKS